MDNKQKLKELADRAKKRMEVMSALKASEDTENENQDFAFLKQQLYKEITGGVQRDRH